MTTQKKKIILAIDPGTRKTGYAVLEIDGNALRAVDYGRIVPPPFFLLSERYLIIFQGIAHLIEEHKPEEVAVELQFVKINVQSALKLGMAKACAILAAKQRDLPVFEYAPTVAKKAVVGTGKASKHQVQKMVQRILNLSDSVPEDAADALALAICHAHTAPHLLNEHEV